MHTSTTHCGGGKPGFADVQSLTSSLKARMDRLDAATAGLGKALAAEPGSARTLVQLGHAYLKGGYVGRAAEHYEKDLSIDRSDIRALGILANIYATWGEYGKAEGRLKRIVELQPENADAYYNVACMYARQKKVDEALVWLRQAVARGFDKWDLIAEDPDMENIRDTDYVTGLIRERGAR
jgi:tetratricopeptide (TPR) repeat protein